MFPNNKAFISPYSFIDALNNCYYTVIPTMCQELCSSLRKAVRKY